MRHSSVQKLYGGKQDDQNEQSEVYQIILKDTPKMQRQGMSLVNLSAGTKNNLEYQQ